MAKANERARNLVVRLAEDELAMMHAIVGAERETAATLIRRWIRQHHEALGLGSARATTKGAKR